MKYKKQLKRLEEKQNWWDKQDKSYQNSTRRPGSVKTR